MNNFNGNPPRTYGSNQNFPRQPNASGRDGLPLHGASRAYYPPGAPPLAQGYPNGNAYVRQTVPGPADPFQRAMMQQMMQLTQMNQMLVGEVMNLRQQVLHQQQRLEDIQPLPVLPSIMEHESHSNSSVQKRSLFLSYGSVQMPTDKVSIAEDGPGQVQKKQKLNRDETDHSLNIVEIEDESVLLNDVPNPVVQSPPKGFQSVQAEAVDSAKRRSEIPKFIPAYNEVSTGKDDAPEIRQAARKSFSMNSVLNSPQPELRPASTEAPPAKEQEVPRAEVEKSKSDDGLGNQKVAGTYQKDQANRGRLQGPSTESRRKSSSLSSKVDSRLKESSVVERTEGRSAIPNPELSQGLQSGAQLKLPAVPPNGDSTFKKERLVDLNDPRFRLGLDKLNLSAFIDPNTGVKETTKRPSAPITAGETGYKKSARPALFSPVKGFADIKPALKSADPMTKQGISKDKTSADASPERMLKLVAAFNNNISRLRTLSDAFRKKTYQDTDIDELMSWCDDDRAYIQEYAYPLIYCIECILGAIVEKAKTEHQPLIALFDVILKRSASFKYPPLQCWFITIKFLLEHRIAYINNCKRLIKKKKISKTNLLISPHITDFKLPRFIWGLKLSMAEAHSANVVLGDIIPAFQPSHGVRSVNICMFIPPLMRTLYESFSRFMHLQLTSWRGRSPLSTSILRVIRKPEVLRYGAQLEWPRGTVVKVTKNDDKKSVVLNEERRVSQVGLNTQESLNVKPIDLGFILQSMDTFQLEIIRSHGACSCFMCDNVFFAVEVVMNIPKAILRRRIVQTIEPDAASITLLQDNHRENNDRLISVDVGCPISKTRIKTPVRGKVCNHFTCFDLDAFLDMAPPLHRLCDWKCPICHLHMGPLDLVNVSWFQREILKYCSKSEHEFALYNIELMEYVPVASKGEIAPHEREIAGMGLIRSSPTLSQELPIPATQSMSTRTTPQRVEGADELKTNAQTEEGQSKSQYEKPDHAKPIEQTKKEDIKATKLMETKQVDQFKQTKKVNKADSGKSQGSTSSDNAMEDTPPALNRQKPDFVEMDFDCSNPRPWVRPNEMSTKATKVEEAITDEEKTNTQKRHNKKIIISGDTTPDEDFESTLPKVKFIKSPARRSIFQAVVVKSKTPSPKKDEQVKTTEKKQGRSSKLSIGEDSVDTPVPKPSTSIKRLPMQDSTVWSQWLAESDSEEDQLFGQPMVISDASTFVKQENAEKHIRSVSEEAKENKSTEKDQHSEMEHGDNSTDELFGEPTILPGSSVPDVEQSRNQGTDDDPLQVDDIVMFGEPVIFSSQLNSSGPSQLDSYESTSGFDVRPSLGQKSLPKWLTDLETTDESPEKVTDQFLFGESSFIHADSQSLTGPLLSSSGEMNCS